MKDFLTPLRKTWMHRANPVAKLVLLLILFFVTMFTHDLDAMLCIAVIFTLLLFLLSGHALWKILLITLPFLLIFVSSSLTMILFGKGDTVWWQWGIISISEESFYRGIHIGFKAVSFASEGLLFALTTPSVSLFYALMQKVKLPPKYAYSFMASIRLLPMVWEEYQTRRSALQVRGVQIRRGIPGLFEQVKLFAVPLLSQSIRRAHRVAIAMESKKFDSKQPRTYYYASYFSRYDLYVAVLLFAAAAIAYMAASAYPLFEIHDVRYR